MKEIQRSVSSSHVYSGCHTDEHRPGWQGVRWYEDTRVGVAVVAGVAGAEDEQRDAG